VPKLVTPAGLVSPPTLQSSGELAPWLVQLAPPPLASVTSAMYWRSVEPSPLVVPAWKRASRLSLTRQSTSSVT
jgi:hypothetical protein